METYTQEQQLQTPVKQIPSHIFRANDIRGVVDRDLTPEVYYRIGLSFGTQMRNLSLNRCVVARDGRLSGPRFKQALCEGLLSTGVEVIDIDLAPSPMLYFATHYLKTGTGLMITGSHNPSNYNGIKMMLGGKTLNQDGILELKKTIEQENYISGQGHLVKQDVKQAYIDKIQSIISLDKPLKVVIDCGHGAAAVIAEQLYQALGIDVVPLYCEVDGAFPAHHPDPSVESNLSDLIEKVKQENADFGLAFDGDGDRLGCVTREGQIIKPDRQLMLYAKSVLAQAPGAPIIFDVKCSQHLTAVIQQAGGQAVMHKTGHAFIKSKMLELESPLAGEMSGHFFFGEPWLGFDDALFAGARLCEILSKESQSPSEVFQQLPDSVNTPELQIKIEDDRKFDFMNQLKQTNAFNGAKLITIDGLRVEYDDGWGLVRASNTSPCLVLRFESDTLQGLQRLQALFKQVITELAPDLNIPF